MTTYLHTYQRPDGLWSGLLLRPDSSIGPFPYPVDVVAEATQRAPGVQDLPGTLGDESSGVVAVLVPEALAPWLAARGLTVAEVLASFARDLAETPDSNGSDERRLANEWFERVVWPEDDAGMDDEEDEGDGRSDDLSPVTRARVAAMEWRKSDQANDISRVSGVVLVYDGEAYGWKSQLRDPSHERPGAMAVDVVLGVWVAEGGNPQDGAERWVPYRG